MVLDLPIRLHDVGANLAAEGNLELGFVECVGVRLVLLAFQVLEARAKPLHGQPAIFVLAVLGLAAHHDAGGNVRDAPRTPTSSTNPSSRFPSAARFAPTSCSRIGRSRTIAPNSSSATSTAFSMATSTPSCAPT